MKIKFIVKPPAKEEYQRELLIFKKEFKGKIEEEFSEREGEKSTKNLAKKAVKEGFDRIVLVGGDGTLSGGVNGVMEATEEKLPTNFAIGIVPTGAGNNFAKTIGIPKNIKEAFEIIKNDKKRLVDIGRANERFFVNCISFGFDAKINKLANDLKEKHRFLPKGLSYLLAALKEIVIKIPLFEMQITAEGKKIVQNLISLAVTNGPTYGGIFKINPGALVDDGELDICYIETVGRFRALFDIYKIIKGTHIYLPEVKMFKTSSLSVSSPEPLPYETDGEVLEPEKEYKISILPKTLKFLVP